MLASCEDAATVVRTVGDVSRRKLSPSESRLTRFRLVVRFIPASSNGQDSVSTGLLPFQNTREKGHSPSSGLSR